MVSQSSASMRQLPLATRLYFWWDSQPPGHGAALDEMVRAIGAGDRQTVRGALVKLRKGEIRDPSSPESILNPMPVHYSPSHKRYYNFASVNREIVAAQVPASALEFAIQRLLTVARNLESALGKDGLAISAQQYLKNADTRALIRQLPIEAMWSVQGTALRIAQAKQLLMIEEATRDDDELDEC